MDTKTKTDRFSFTKADPNFRDLLWVLSARSSDETRSAMRGLHVEIGDATAHYVATNGRRLHMWTGPTDWIAAGEYKAVKVTRSIIILERVPDGDWTFPNWRRVMPDPGGVTIRNLGAALQEVDTWNFKKQNFATSGAQFVAHLALLNPTLTINLDFLAGIGEGDWTANLDDGKKSILFADGNQTAVVACMRLD